MIFVLSHSEIVIHGRVTIEGTSRTRSMPASRPQQLFSP